MALSFWFRMRIIDNTNYNWCYGFCWAIPAESQECFCFSCCHASGEQGVHKKLGEVRTRTSDPNWPKGFHMSCNMFSNKNWGKGGRERHNQRNSVCLPMWHSIYKLCFPEMSAFLEPYFSGWASTCLLSSLYVVLFYMYDLIFLHLFSCFLPKHY